MTTEPSDRALTAYRATEGINVGLVPASGRRAWIDSTPDHFANRCLPLLMAGQSGWWLTNPVAFSAGWNGGATIGDIWVEAVDGNIASTHFGSGVLTFSIPWLFRLPEGWNLHARGPINWPKDGIMSLEGIVEADHAHQTFTMNWLFTRPGMVRFEEGEPVCHITPVRRGELETFSIIERSLSDDPELEAQHDAWAASRSKFNEDLDIEGSEAQRLGWQKIYQRSARQTKLHLKKMELPTE